MIITGGWFLLIIGLGLYSLSGLVKRIFFGQSLPSTILVTVVLILCVGLEAFLIHNLQAQVVRYRTAWKSTSTVQKDSFVYVALGDSAAQGIGASAIASSYVSIIAEQIRAQTQRPVTVINLSKSGGRLQDVLTEQIPQLGGLKPDLVTVDIGSNNITAGTPDAVMDADYTTMIKQLSAYPTVFANLPDFMWGKQQRNTKNINKTILQASADNKVILADLHKVTMARMWSWNEFAADGFHPNNNGHKTWARAFEPAVLQVIKNK